MDRQETQRNTQEVFNFVWGRSLSNSILLRALKEHYVRALAEITGKTEGEIKGELDIIIENKKEEFEKEKQEFLAKNDKSMN